jgi:hypothetical protein
MWSQPAAYSARTGLLYVPSTSLCGVLPRHVTGVGGVLSARHRACGTLTALDATSGAARWRYRSRRPMLAAVVIVDDLVVTGEMTVTSWR